MIEKRPSVSGAPPWLFVSLVLGFAAYYAHDVWGGRFETVAYGFLCISLLAVLGLALLISAIRQKRHPGSETEGLERQAKGVSKNLRPFSLLLLLIAYAVVQASAGFLVATLLAFACLLWFFGERRWPYLLATAIGMALLTHLIFVEILSIPVPAGTLVD